MIEIIEKKYCTGCEACLNVCPHAAIMMVRDHEGFDYPSIYSDKCVDCGLCVKVCPVLHYEDIADKRKIYNDVQKAIAAKTISVPQSNIMEAVYCTITNILRVFSPARLF